MTDELHPFPGEWHWWASNDSGEHLTAGPAETREDLIEMIKDDGSFEYQAKDGSWRIAADIGEYLENHQDLARWFRADWFIENAADSMDDNDCGSDEDGERHPVDEITEEQAADLEVSVRTAIRKWQKRHGLRLRSYWFAESRNEEHVDIAHPGEST